MSPSARLTSFGRDISVLGAWAPVRVAYELSRRTPVHGALLQRVAARSAPISDVGPSLALPPVEVIPEPVRARTLEDARSIRDGQIKLFSRVMDLGVDPDWHAALDGSGRWPDEPWWTIELRSATTTTADVKWVWELGRHRHLVVLARAVQLEPDIASWRELLSMQLRSFIAVNPPERGVHWSSSLELALRSFAWLEILARAGSHLDTTLRADMAGHLWHHGLHMIAELPYSLSSMQNNHLLGEAAGLHALGRALGLHRWERLGGYLYAAQLRREIASDGATIEESLSYQRFVMDIVARHISSAPHDAQSRAALARGAGLLRRLGVGEGPVPQFGDWDEGRALAVSGDPAELDGIAQLAEALGGCPGAPGATTSDEVAWYALEHPPNASEVPHRTGGGRTPAHAVVQGAPVGAGLARATRGDFAVWLRAGHTRWHAHADLCSVSVRLRDQWVIGDPGTGSYNADDEVRSWFRSSAAHSVLELDGREQVAEHRRFRWCDDPWARLGAPIHHGSTTVMWGVHLGYGIPVGRAVILEDDAVSILDAVSPTVPGPLRYTLRFAFGPGVSTGPEGTIRLGPHGASRGLRLNLPQHGNVQICSSRWSPTYSSVIESVAAVGQGIAQGPILTTLALEHAVQGRLIGGTWRRGDTRVGFGWRGSLIVLSFVSPTGTFTRALRAPRS